MHQATVHTLCEHLPRTTSAIEIEESSTKACIHVIEGKQLKQLPLTWNKKKEISLLSARWFSIRWDKGRSRRVIRDSRSLSFRSRYPPPPSGFFEGNLSTRGCLGNASGRPFCCRVLGVIVSRATGRRVTFGETIFADPFDATWMRWRVIMARRGFFSRATLRWGATFLSSGWSLPAF